MRIITGRYKGYKITSPKSNNIRPTTDKVRQAIFSIIGEIKDKKFLDLFAGTGAIGLEAVSRGCSFVSFVDNSFNSIKTVKKNIDNFKDYNTYSVVKSSVNSYLSSNDYKYDIIFLDPPYNGGFVNKTLKKIFKHNTLCKSGSIVVEHSKYEIINHTVKSIHKFGETIVSVINY